MDHLRSLLVVILVCGMLTGCSRNEPLRVAVPPWIGYETLFLARDFGWLSHDVVLLESGSPDGAEEALTSGQVDAAALTLEEVLLARSNGLDLSAVLVFNVSAGGDALLARPQIGSLKALRGTRVGLAPSALASLLLSRALASAGLGLDDVQQVPLPINEQLAAWRAGRIDALVVYAPFSEGFVAEGAVRLFDSSEMPDAIFDVLAVRRHALKRQQLETLIEAHFRGLEHLRTSREDALYRIAARRSVPVAAVRASLAGVSLPDLARNRMVLLPGSIAEHAARSINRLMVSLEMLPQSDTLDRLFDPRIVSYLREPSL